MAEFVELEDFSKRSNWITRVAITRWRMLAEYSTKGTSQWISIRSNSDPEIR